MSFRIQPWLLGMGAVLLGAIKASACDSPGPFVALRFSGRLAESFQQSVLQDLAAGLARSQVSVCPAQAATPRAPADRLAELEVEARSPQLVALRVRLLAGGTESRLDRQVDLSHVPADSQAFAVALAADELLRAGDVEWLGGAAAEAAGAAAVDPAPGGAGVQPRARERAVPAAEPARWSLGLRPALERFGGGQTLWGADASVLVPLPAGLELLLAPGVRRGLEVTAPQGRIQSSALSLSANARYQLIDASWQLSAGLGLYGARLALEGASTSADTTASRFAGLALYGQGLLSASVPIAGPLRFELSGVFGVPLRELEATADGRVATAVSGLQVGAFSTLWWQL